MTAPQTMLREFRRVPVRRLDWSATDTESASLRYVLFVLVPAWIVPGVLDWYWHKQTEIENTSGLKESLIHSLMMTEVGVPILLGLLFEINPLALTCMFGALVAHSATAIWDVSLAVHHREVTTREQHTHSFLEVLPFMGMAFAATLHSDATHRLLTGNTRRDDWSLKVKRPRLPIPYIAGVMGLIALGVLAPYANEAIRCWKRLRTPKKNTGFYKDLPAGQPEQRNC